VVCSACCQPDPLASFDFTDNPVENYLLLPHSHAVALDTFPCRCKLCTQIFISLLLYRKSSLKICHKFHWMNLRPTIRSPCLSLQLKSVMHSSGKMLNFFLRELREKVLRIAVHIGVHTNFVYLLITNSYIHVFIFIICDKSVLLILFQSILSRVLWPLSCTLRNK